jgi:hypothetical protein
MLHERPSVKAIPQGGKENVLFVLGNENNATRQACRQRPCYAVGLGHMDLVKHTITLCLKISLDNVDKKGEWYFKYVNPNLSTTSFKCYYCCLKRDQSYKKCVSVVTDCPDELNHIKNVVVTEYVCCCNYPQHNVQHNVPHRNNKKTVGDYFRTSCSVKQKLTDMIGTNKRPHEIYKDMSLDNSSCALRDLKQVQNAKYISEKKTRIDKGHNYN